MPPIQYSTQGLRSSGEQLAGGVGVTGAVGLGLGAVYQHILVHEFEYWGAPGPDLTVTSVAPMIMRL